MKNKNKKTNRILPANTQHRRGFMGAAEIATLKTHLKTGKSMDEIAVLMNRTIQQVQREIDKLKSVDPTIEVCRQHTGEQLELRPEWKRWQKQFTPSELATFKSQYIQIAGQFDNNIRATEELQIFQVITLVIMIDRVLEERKLALTDMDFWRAKVEKLRSEYKGKDNNPDHVMEMANLQSQYEMARAVTKTYADHYKTYSDKQDNLLKQLKATRDQRVKIEENADKSFTGLLKFLSDEDNKLSAGQEVAEMRAAADKERRRLQSPIKFRDGAIDRPLLTPESLFEDEPGELPASPPPASEDAEGVPEEGEDA